MFWCILFVVTIIAGVLLFKHAKEYSFTQEVVGPILVAVGVVSLCVVLIVTIVYQCDKNVAFETNMVVRDNIIYAIEGYEQYGDELELNRYDVLQKAMDFNKMLANEQAKADSIFYVCVSNPSYNDVEPIDYSPLLRPKE